MTDSAFKLLRTMLVERYEELAGSLSRYLGSRDAAEEALQDTFVRLSREDAEIAVRNPRSYLFRMALNVAASNRRSETRRLTPIEVGVVLDAVADDAPNAEQIADVRSTLAYVHALVAQLPERRRAIVEAAWFGDAPYREIAQAHGLSLRMIQIELRHGLAHVSEGLAKAGLEDFAPSLRETSKQ